MNLFVQNKVCGCSEGFSAILARMWLFPGMTSFMKFDVFLIFESQMNVFVGRAFSLRYMIFDFDRGLIEAQTQSGS